MLRDGPETDDQPDVRMTVIHVGPTSELNVFEINGNTEAERQIPMFGRGRLDHLAVQAASIEAFETIRDRLIERGAADEFVTDFGPILSVFFRDPDGLECEVCARIRRATGRSQPAGHAGRTVRVTACRCAKTAGTSPAASTTTVRRRGSVCSTSRRRRRGDAPTTVPSTNGRSSTARSCSGSLVRQRVEDEPDEKPEDIQDLFDDAEMILDAAEPGVLADLDQTRKPGRKWWQRGKRKRRDDGDDWHLSSRWRCRIRTGRAATPRPRATPRLAAAPVSRWGS